MSKPASGKHFFGQILEYFLTTRKKDAFFAAVKFTKESHNDTYPAISSNNDSHVGKAVFISGASKGIGRATAISYARAGASHIAIAARSSLDEVEASMRAVSTKPLNVLKIALDVTDTNAVREAAKNTLDAFGGRLDVLINNAGTSEDWVKLDEGDPFAWWSVWEANVKGVYLLTREFLPALLKSDLKWVINVSSIGALLTVPGASGYQMSKFALLRFTEFLEVEYGSKGLTAIAVHPGSVRTELALSKMPKHMHGNLIDTPELAADTYVWLTQKQRPWLGGRYVSVTWDMPELESREKEIVEGDKLKMRLAI